uniref:Reverse transcriptase domain-containing protein n=1 Tax=Meloidogyne enterolobii TaxID=390850 RepID=A0A6V7VVT8_MELEN|nr:unnamed protein product [Meloidogyne enterolobii]
MIEFIDRNQLKQFVKEPTRENAILDIILSNNIKIVQEVQVQENFSTSDHKIVKFNILSKIVRTKLPKIYKRDLCNKNFEKLNHILTQSQIEHHISCKYDVNQKYITFMDKLLEVYNNVIPNKPLNKIIRSSYPQRIRDLYSEKLKLYKIRKNFPNNNKVRIGYRNVSRELKKHLDKFRNESEIRMLSHGQNGFNKYIRNKLNPNNEIPMLIDSDGIIQTDKKKKCELFANVFQQIFKEKTVNMIDYHNDQINNNKLSDIEINLGIIWEILKNLPGKNSTSPDNIPYILLKKCPEYLTKLLGDIFRLTLDEGKIPELWRMSIIIPIFKKGLKTDPRNYRPVSLTSTVCRVFERIVYSQIINFLDEKNFFCREQFGFMKKRSTTLQLLEMMNEFYDAIQNNYNVDVIYIDFKKAFDSVPINILLYKLKRAGIDGKLMIFLENFLTNRSFRVKIDDKLSENKSTHSGVPHGSVLGPLLFLIFINDLPNYISENVGIKMYADDVKLYKIHKNDKSSDLSNSLIRLEKWGQINGLEISPEKCFSLYIGKTNNMDDYYLYEKKIQKCTNIRDLGVIIDSKLTFTDHISRIVRNVYLKSHQLLRIMKTRKLNTLILAYKSYVRSQLEYATEIWNPIQNKDITKIEKVQKFFTRMAFKKCGLVYKKYDERLKICNLQELNIRRKITDMTTTFKIIKGLTCLNTKKCFVFSNRSLRRPLLLRVRSHTTKSQRNFFHRIVKEWNCLSLESMKINKPKEFRELLKTMY